MKKKIAVVAMALSITLCTVSAHAAQWEQDSTGYRYRNDDGSNITSAWANIDNKWYYFKPDGYMNIGWIKVNDKWYYCETSGEMRTADLVTDVMTFKFNTNGSCTNFYDNNTPSDQAGWANYGTTSLSTWESAILNGDIVYYNGQYWAKPDYVSSLKKEEVVYFHDVSEDVQPVDRFALAGL